MLEIILFILKLLCYVLLSVLGVFAIVILVLLFVPFYYASDGYKNEAEWRIRASLHYLNPILRIHILYPSENTVTTRILGIPYHKKEKKCQVMHEAKEQQPGEKASKSKKKSKKKRKCNIIQDIEYYATLWQDNKELILDVLHTVGKALVTILPRDMRANVIFGTGMADVTGFLYAGYCCLQTYLPEGVIVEPVWTEKYLEGSFHLRGKIRLFPLVVALFRIISDKNVRILYKKLRRV